MLCWAGWQTRSMNLSRLDYIKSEDGNVGSLIISGDPATTLSWSFDPVKRSAVGIPYGTYALGQGSPEGDITLTMRQGLTDPTGSMHLLEIPASSTVLLLNTTDKPSTIQAPSFSDPVDVTDLEFLLGSLISPLINRLMN